MKNVDYDTVCLTELSTRDFEDPFMALNEIFEGASAESMQDECWEVFTIAFRPYYWMKYESPLEIYKKYKKIIKLLELGWLIYNIRPNYLTRGTISESFPFDNGILSMSEIEGDIESRDSYRLFIKLYNENMLLLYKLDLFDILLIGLKTTCDRGETNVGDAIFGRFKEINALIKILHNVMRFEKDQDISDVDLRILKQIEEQYAKINGCLIFDSDMRDIIGKFTKKQDLQTVLESSEFLLYQNNYWRWHNNPGNVIYYFHHYLFIYS